MTKKNFKVTKCHFRVATETTKSFLIKSAKNEIPKCKICTLEEMTIINALRDNPKTTQKALAERIGKSERTVKTRTVEMQEKGLIKRKNGKRNGEWVFL